MKYLLIALVLGALLTIIYLRLRPYINMARRVLGVVRAARGMNAGQPLSSATQHTNKEAERLVRCASCGTWFPASRALTIRSTSSNFCSHACMERSAGEAHTPRAAGSQQ